jgi:type III restriction enzyme
MKLKFDSNLRYQTEEISSVVDLFEGQNSMLSYFTVTGQVSLDKSTHGVSNKVDISDEDILKNLRNVQTINRLAPTESLNSLDFNIEMETGTGKTYVYLKTIFELNKRYGFKKFIVVVPSVAIKEGVYKSIEITRDHFRGLYENIPYDAFIYDSSKLEQVRNFAVSSEIQIMIINIDNFNKSFTKNALDETKKISNTNIIHRAMLSS